MRSSQVCLGLMAAASLVACALPPTVATFTTKQGGGYSPSYRYMQPELLRQNRDVMVAQPTPTPSPGYALPYYRKLDPEAVLLNPQPLPPSPDPPEYLTYRRYDKYLLNPQPLPPSPDPPYEAYRPIAPYLSN